MPEGVFIDNTSHALNNRLVYNLQMIKTQWLNKNIMATIIKQIFSECYFQSI